MGRVSVRTCDFCDEWDHPEARVLKVTVIGPRFDVCAAHRIKILTGLGTSEDKAIAYIKAQDERANARQSVGEVDEDDSDVESE